MKLIWATARPEMSSRLCKPRPRMPAGKVILIAPSSPTVGAPPADQLRPLLQFGSPERAATPDQTWVAGKQRFSRCSTPSCRPDLRLMDRCRNGLRLKEDPNHRTVFQVFIVSSLECNSRFCDLAQTAVAT